MLVSQIISQKLTRAFSPTHLDVINESHYHKVSKGAQSHFKVVIVSDFFKDKKRLERHRAINHTLAEELVNSIHALAIHPYSVQEWQDSVQEWQESQPVPNSPKCVGGAKIPK